MENSSKIEVEESLKSSESSSFEDLIPPEPSASEPDTKQSESLTSPVLEYFVAEKDLQDAISNTNMTSSPSTADTFNIKILGNSMFYSELTEKVTEPSSSDGDTGESFDILRNFNQIRFLTEI